MRLLFELANLRTFVLCICLVFYIYTYKRTNIFAQKSCDCRRCLLLWTRKEIKSAILIIHPLHCTLKVYNSWEHADRKKRIFGVEYFACKVTFTLHNKTREERGREREKKREKKCFSVLILLRITINLMAFLSLPLIIARMQNCTSDISARNDWPGRKRVPILRAREDS